MTETETDTTFRVWIGCLACYNAGFLIGDWYDAETAGDVTTRELHAAHNITTDDAGNVRGAEVYGPHEEMWCLDIENAPEGYRREMSPAEAQEIAEKLAEIGDDAEPFAAWCANNGDSLTTADVDTFREQYAGEWESIEAYAYEFADDIGLFTVTPSRYGDVVTLPDDHPLVTYFDWEKWARGLILSGDYWTHKTPDYRVWIFRSY